MSREMIEYERGWAVCRRCLCRRPERELFNEMCIDATWCQTVALQREEQLEIAEEARKKVRRPRKR